MNEDELLSTKEVAEVLELSLGLIGRYCRDGRLAAQRVGNRWVVRREDVEAFKLRPRPVGRPKQQAEEASDE